MANGLTAHFKFISLSKLWSIVFPYCSLCSYSMLLIYSLFAYLAKFMDFYRFFFAYHVFVRRVCELHLHWMPEHTQKTFILIIFYCIYVTHPNHKIVLRRTLRIWIAWSIKPAKYISVRKIYRFDLSFYRSLNFVFFLFRCDAIVSTAKFIRRKAILWWTFK